MRKSSYYHFFFKKPRFIPDDLTRNVIFIHLNVCVIKVCLHRSNDLYKAVTWKTGLPCQQRKNCTQWNVIGKTGLRVICRALTKKKNKRVWSQVRSVVVSTGPLTCFIDRKRGTERERSQQITYSYSIIIRNMRRRCAKFSSGTLCLAYILRFYPSVKY